MPKILVVDDHRDTLTLIKEYLRKEQFDVILCENAKQGLRESIEQMPDLILLDIMLPDKSGLELCRVLVNHPVTSAIPLIFITARVSPEDLRAGFQAGGIDYIRKPIGRMELIERVNSALKRVSASKQQVETEKRNVFKATVVAANHKLKQPLTLINLSVTALRRLLKQQPPDEDQIEKKLVAIQNSVGDINEVLSSFLSTENIVFKEYISGINMVDVQPPINGSDAEDRPQD
jgi:DNA-binding response OmpR family regulator